MSEMVVEGTRWGRRHVQVWGERHGSAKLTSEKVRAMREDYQLGGWTHESLARKYGVSRSLVGKIIRGAVWGRLIDLPLDAPGCP